MGEAESFDEPPEFQGYDLAHETGPTDAEREMLDEALSDYEQDQDVGTPWREVIERIQNVTGTP